MNKKLLPIVSAVAASLAICLVAALPAQADLVYALNAVPGSGSAGVTIVDGKTVKIAQGTTNATFTMDIVATISGAVGGDGLNSGYMSFRSLNGATNLPVNVTGVTLDGSGPPYTGFWASAVGPQYGTIRDVDADGDLDLGSTRGADASASFYGPAADTTGNNYIGGPIVGGTMTVHIGTLSVKVPSAGSTSQSASMHVIPRYKSSTTIQDYWKQGGVAYTGTGSGTALGAGTGLVQYGPDVNITVATVDIPEPTTLALLGMGALGLLGFVWRRKRSA